MEIVDMIQEIVAVLFKPTRFISTIQPFIITGFTDSEIVTQKSDGILSA